jgi:flagellar protein FlaJ
MVELNFLPLLVAVALALPMLLAPVSERVDRVSTRFALVLFGDYVQRTNRRRGVRLARLRAAHVPTTFRQYAAKTLLYGMLAALVAGILGMYVIWLVLVILAIPPEVIEATVPSRLAFLSEFVGVPSLSIAELFSLVTVTSLTLGAGAGFFTYWFRWWYPETVADDRQRRIDATLPRAVAFVYALSRSGMAFPEVMRILAANRRVYGETAEEVGVGVRNMDLFGMDLITAIQTMSRRSPSATFKEFSENLSSVLQSGRSLSEFLRRQYDDFQEEAKAQQEQLLDQLATLAEAYVTVFVAGPLFLISTLVVMGISVGDTLQPLRVLVYVILPLGNFVFLLYINQQTSGLSAAQRIRDFTEERSPMAAVRRKSEPATDGGRSLGAGSQNLERLAAYRKLRWVRRRVGQPVRTVIDDPKAMLWVTVPITVVVTVARLYVTAMQGPLTPSSVDDVLIQSTLFLVGSFAIGYEIHKRRIEAIEAAVPDLLGRLASVNEAGMTIVESLDRVRGSELGALDEELERVWADIRWGADVEMALKRFERRVRTPTISRVVTLLTNAMNASGDLAAVLRIAADQAKADRRLKRQRRQEMLTYMVVVYIAFFVFLFIIVVLSTVLIPNLPSESIVPNASSGQGAQGVPSVGAVGQVGGIDAGAYKLVFFHTAIIQGLLSGFVAGQLASGDVREGAKHAAVLIAMAYGLFLVMI